MLAYKKLFDDMFTEVNRVIVGQDEMIKQILSAILANGNALLEGYPGLAKTLTVRTLARIMDLRFSRIQNTPDLMPSDITGTYVLEEQNGKREFKFHPGPIFANIVLADEINRATPKTQSALLEAMQEKQVTVGNTTYRLDLPFFVLATQNPIEQEGSLALGQHVFVNGRLKTGAELLAEAGSKCIAKDKNGIKLYNTDSWTFSLNETGKLEKQKCMLYTLPYKDEMVTIATKTGKKITVTKNHPFLVNDRGTITWKKAEELTKDDYLVNPASLSAIPEQNVMSHQDAVAQMAQRPLEREIPFDKDFAFWIAFVLSDGYIGEKCIAAVQKNYPEALDRFMEISKKYGFKCGVSEKDGCREARIYSKPLVEYLKIRFGVTGGKGKEIPTWFLSFPQEMNREFLKTFISLESSLRDNRIVFTQKSARNVSLISYMLLRERIISWTRHDGRVFRMKIQGIDFLKYLEKIGWVAEEKTKEICLDRKVKSSFRIVPVDRKKILRLVEILGINSFHTLPQHTDITARQWYGSYKGIKEGENVMAVESLKCFASDMKREITARKTAEFSRRLETSPREFAAAFGTPMTQIAKELKISKNQVWQLYNNGNSASSIQIKEFLAVRQTEVLQEAGLLASYCEALLSEDVYYDGIKSIEYSKPEGMAFGLTVPGLQNYLAGFGGCGINHNTYPLPEAQSDRFMLKIKVIYPSFDEEMEIVNRYTGEEIEKKLKVVITKEQLLDLQALTRQVPISSELKQFIVSLVSQTRTAKELIEYGASPRASTGLVLASKARALISGRNHVGIEDVKAMAYPVLRHRIILNFEAERKGLTPDGAIKIMLDRSK